ncbi:hypothetical protein LCGC14_2334300 [marine sediment metagenome]|uniref:Uncharacterized protein n=1 Tax=marine sediment metagenome TaxID=412755 RepID=A0A0F9F8W5_9ZZZZ
MSEMEELSTLTASGASRTTTAIAMFAGGRVIAGTVAIASMGTRRFIPKIATTETARHYRSLIGSSHMGQRVAWYPPLVK